MRMSPRAHTASAAKASRARSVERPPTTARNSITARANFLRASFTGLRSPVLIPGVSGLAISVIAGVVAKTRTGRHPSAARTYEVGRSDPRGVGEFSMLQLEHALCE